jgi:hypothetical protein
MLSWNPQLAERRKWLLTANGYTVVSLLGTDGIRHLAKLKKLTCSYWLTLFQPKKNSMP